MLPPAQWDLQWLTLLDARELAHCPRSARDRSGVLALQPDGLHGIDGDRNAQGAWAHNQRQHNMNGDLPNPLAAWRDFARASRTSTLRNSGLDCRALLGCTADVRVSQSVERMARCACQDSDCGALAAATEVLRGVLHLVALARTRADPTNCSEPLCREQAQAASWCRTRYCPRRSDRHKLRGRGYSGRRAPVSMSHTV